MNKIYLLVLVLIVTVVTFLRRGNRDKQQIVITKSVVSHEKNVKKYANIKNILHEDLSEFTKSVKIGDKKYLISNKKRAIDSKLYKLNMGKKLKEKNGFTIYEIENIEAYDSYSRLSLPVISRVSKPINSVLTGKVVIRSKKLNEIKDYFISNGFVEIDRIKNMNLAVYQAPEGKSLDLLLNITDGLPFKSSLSWEVLTSPNKLR